MVSRGYHRAGAMDLVRMALSQVPLLVPKPYSATFSAFAAVKRKACFFPKIQGCISLTSN